MLYNKYNIEMGVFMRAYEFIKENASAGGTSAGNVATVVKPLTTKGEETFFGGDTSKYPKYGDITAVIRRPSPTAEAGK